MANPYEQYAPAPANPYEQFKPAAAAQDDEAGTNAVLQKNSMLPETGLPGALGVGAVNGATANFADEFYGLLKAGGGGLPQVAALGVNPGHAVGTGLVGLARLGYEHLTGKPGEATKAYEEARDQWRRKTDQAEEQHPTATLVGNVAGAVALPGLAAARSAPLAIRAVRGSITGAGVGGLSGVGAGEDLGDRAVQGGAGIVGGAVAGGVAVPAGELVTRGVSAAGRYAGGLYRSVFNPEAEAGRRVAQRVLDAQERGGRDVVPIQEMAARQAEGQPLTNLDVAGQGGRVMARSVRNTPGADEGTQALQGAVQDRFRDQAERTASWLDRHTPFKNGVNFDRIMENNRSANAPAYNRAYAEGRAAIARDGEDAFMTRELLRLAGAPDIERAFGSVGRKEGNRTIIEGFQSPRQSPFARDERGRLVARELPGGRSNAIPDLESWDQVQRVLGARARAAASKPGGADEARQIGLLRDQLNTELDRIVPSFQTARGTAWRGFRADNAYDAGMNYVSSTALGREAQGMQRQIANMTQDERHLFAAGFAQSLIARVRGTADSADVVRRIYNTPEARDRIRQSLGPQLAHEMDAFLHVEAVMNYGRNAVTGNSSAVAQLLSAGMAGGVGYSAITGNWDASSIVAGAAAAGGRRIMSGSQANLANRVGQMLASNDPRMFAGGIQVLARSRDLLQNLRLAVDQLASRGPAQQAGGVAGEAARGIMRADDNSQPAPGPNH